MVNVGDNRNVTDIFSNFVMISSIIFKIYFLTEQLYHNYRDRIIQEPRHHYYMLHKTTEAVTVKRDAHHPTVIELVDPQQESTRLYPLGASIATPVVAPPHR